MLEKIYINEPKHTDLNMYRCGIEDCTSGYSWGPGVRDHYIIHYVLGGKGRFHVNGQTYTLKEQDGFLICPNTIVHYEADKEDPWSYCWAGFHGLKAEHYLKHANLSPGTPVFTCDKMHEIRECFSRMISTKNLGKSKEIILLGLLYEFLGILIESSAGNGTADNSTSRKESYVKKAVEFIAMNYSRKISVAEIAHHVGIDRSYLYSLCEEYLNASPQKFIINYRMNKACELMINKALTIGDISRSIGYDDPLVFSKVFKKVKGVSPSEYRDSAKECKPREKDA